MTTREIAAEYRLAQWAQALQARVTSGESIKDFCQSKGVSRNTYFYWQRKLRETACRELAVTKPKNKTFQADNTPAPSGWALCEVAEPKATCNVLPIEIGKFRVLADADTDAELLAKVCKTLVSLC